MLCFVVVVLLVWRIWQWPSNLDVGTAAAIPAHKTMENIIAEAETYAGDTTGGAAADAAGASGASVPEAPSPRWTWTAFFGLAGPLFVHGWSWVLDTLGALGASLSASGGMVGGATGPLFGRYGILVASVCTCLAEAMGCSYAGQGALALAQS